MAKRRAAEPLTFRVPWKRLLLSDFPEGPPLWVPPAGSRKRQGDAGTMVEPAAAPSKRRGGGDGGQERQLCRGLEPGKPPPGEQEEPRGGGDDGMVSAGSGADGAHVQVGPPRTSPEPGPRLRKSGPFEGLDQMVKTVVLRVSSVQAGEFGLTAIIVELVVGFPLASTSYLSLVLGWAEGKGVVWS